MATFVEWDLPDITCDVNGNTGIYYENNKNLKKADVTLPYSDEHIKEFMKCKDDIFYFAEKYYHIRSLDEGIIKIKLRYYQKTMLQSFVDNRNTIVNATRQCGKSTAFEIFVCHYILFQEQKSVAILANKAMSATNILRKVKVAYELLPKWLQSGVKTWNGGMIELENGCAVLAAATSSSAIRSFAINTLIIDEMAFIANNIWTEFFSSVYPTVSSSKTSKTILVSTPNGMNHFYRYWFGATTKDPKLKNTFNPIQIHWSEVPGRDAQWKKETLSNMTLEEFNREFEGEFLGSSLTLINPKTLKHLHFKSEIKESDLHDELNEFAMNLRLFRKVKQNHRYIMSVDSAKVHEDTSGDPVAIQVIDITRYPFKQVAAFRATHNMHYLQIPEVAYKIGKYFNWAFAFIENNEIGQQIADSIAYEFEYENVFFEVPNLAGYRTTKKTKRLGCSNIKGWIEKGKLQVFDPFTIEELSTFIKHKNGSYAAEEGYTDDLVMALMGCLFFTTRPEFDAFTDLKQVSEVLFNEGKIIEIAQALEDELPMFGVIDAEGIDDYDGFSVF